MDGLQNDTLGVVMEFLSLGAGVQSTTLYLMAHDGELPKPDAAVFANTGWEPKAVYKHLEWLQSLNSIPIKVVGVGEIRKDMVANAEAGSGFAAMPFRAVTPNAPAGGVLRRQCTREYKVTPITKKIRELMGYKPRQRIKETCKLWIGITIDEAARMKPNRERWIKNTWPLIDLNMSREDCKTWLIDHSYPVPPKSSCIGCPYHDDALWREMKQLHPDEFHDAVDFERTIHTALKNVKGELYLHRSLQFLDQVDFRNEEDFGQLNMFINECEGFCGT